MRSENLMKLYNIFTETRCINNKIKMFTLYCTTNYWFVKVKITVYFKFVEMLLFSVSYLCIFNNKNWQYYSEIPVFIVSAVVSAADEV